MRDRRGFTLIETLIALAVVAVLSAIGFPRMRALFVKGNVRSARSTVINTFQWAKARALAEGRSTRLNFDNSTGLMWVTAYPRRTTGGGSTLDTVGQMVNLTQRYGVTVQASDTFHFDLRGLGTNSSGTAVTVVLTGSGYRDSVNVNGYGRITK